MSVKVRAPRLGVLLLTLAIVSGSPSAQACDGAAPDPAITPPGRAILGFPYRRALTPEINRYVGTVDAQSDRVSSGTFATSWNGTHLTYALVGSEENLARVDEIAATQQALRDPRRTDKATATRIAATTPAIVWYTGNVHGDETSGADAALEILYRLAAGRDCIVEGMLRNLVVGIIPTQNPDGRDGLQRTNAYSFDMNRDWFAATQPETAGKLALLSKYPPVLFIDAHEQGSSNFFFPPNADPIHHEISPEALHWINDLYAPAMAEAFNQRRESDPLNWDFFNYDIYDLFYMGYGDTVPTTAFTAAGMTFEKGLADADHQRMIEQFVAGWTSLQVAAANRRSILDEYYRAHRTALAEGARGFLEPNMVLQPENTLRRKVPALQVRHYFIDTRRAATDANRLVDRLMRMGVEVYRLDEPVSVPDLKRFGRAPAAAHIPAGAYWIPMAQPQKRWIQAILGEDSYVPFPYFYDVTSWSNPLLMNLGSASSGAELDPAASRVHTTPQAGLRDAGGASFIWFHGETGAEVAGALALARDGVDLRRLSRPKRVDFGVLHRGAFIVPRPADAAKVQEVAQRFGFEAHRGPAPCRPANRYACRRSRSTRRLPRPGRDSCRRNRSAICATCSSKHGSCRSRSSLASRSQRTPFRAAGTTSSSFRGWGPTSSRSRANGSDRGWKAAGSTSEPHDPAGRAEPRSRWRADSRPPSSPSPRGSRCRVRSSVSRSTERAP